VKSAALFFVLLATSLGCNSILGIDPARLDTSDAGSEAGAVVPQGDATCTVRNSTPCNTCVAKKCCAELDACNADPACKQGLVAYAFCLGNNFTSDAGASCDEDFVATAKNLSLDLATCAFFDQCQSECTDQTIGNDLCTNYCTCMQEICSDHPFEAASCIEICSNFDANQLVCRPYHCNLARLNRLDESKRTLHCGHASGNSPCH